ncbi:MAG: tetratricopeptide repeat protein [Candidatus Omnitrophica bacterium]|nr:tetratricopeptide repeat protein [Candidatus Omnitrophota bacterium]MDD3987519.1 tetratricopeptide repeat protein [Candidatus Omnitrophota bacterium]MDD5664727.1 tetratricopeptide repeat protein [Candidatus Omnitrophota bacterium]
MAKRFFWFIPALFFIVLGLGNTSLASNRKGSLPLSHYIMALYYDDTGQWDLAIKEYEKALRLDWDNYLTHFNLALTWVRKNDIERAKDSLSQALKINPEASEPHALLAILNLAEGKFDLAAKEYELALKSAVRLNPKDVEMYKVLAGLYIRQGNIQEAKDTYRIISELTPNDPEVHFYLGVVYAELKESVSLEESFKKAISLKPDYAQALNFLGYTYVEDNRNLKEAEGLIRRALAVDPDNGAYLDSLGWLFYKKGRIKEARDTLIRAASLMPDAVIFDHLGDVYFKMKDAENARINWQESLRLNPDQEKVEEKLKGLKK